jgi:Tol biopolymer transport system component
LGRAGPAIAAGTVATVVVVELLLLRGVIGRGGESPSPGGGDGQACETCSETPSEVAPSERAPSEVVGPSGDIAFSVKESDTEYDIFVGSAEDESVEPLIVAGGADVQLSWSQHGTRIAWSAADGIRIANADGSGNTLLSDHGTQDRKPEWSPDDTLIVFASSRDGDFDLYTHQVDGTDQNVLTDNDGVDFDPSWSAATDRIAFASDRAGGLDIWTIDPDGANPRPLSGDDGAAGGDDEDPAWSPDGRQIAFASDRDRTYKVYVANADGSDAQLLAPGPSIQHDPTWSADGRFIAFAQLEPPAILIVDVATHEEVGSLSQDGALVIHPAWRHP